MKYVISAFIASGKTTFLESCTGSKYKAYDLSNMEFTDEFEEEFNSKHSEDNCIILVNTDLQIRNWLESKDIEYTLVYPSTSSKEMYLSRMKESENYDPSMNNNFDLMVESLKQSTNKSKIELDYIDMNTGITKGLLVRNLGVEFKCEGCQCKTCVNDECNNTDCSWCTKSSPKEECIECVEQ